MEQILESSKGYFYTNLISAACSILCFLIGYILRKKFIELKFMYIYPLGSLAQHFSYYVISLYSGDKIELLLNKVNGFSIYVFLAIEFTCIFSFYYRIIQKKYLKSWVRLIPIAYIIIFSLKFINKLNPLTQPFDFFFLQAIFILLSAIIYIIQLIKDDPKPSLFNEPSFWITIGVLLYFLCTIPIYLASPFIFDNVDGLVTELELFSINFICYSIFFLLITRAYLCKAAGTL